MQIRVWPSVVSWLVVTGLTIAPALGQQVPDDEFNPPIGSPAFELGRGPLVHVDAAHNNFHTADGRYGAFARLLRRDGYIVESNDQQFSRSSLARGQVLVIANAIADENVNDWTRPTPSAFSDDEIQAVEEWVRQGGSLLLIADHMPIAGNAEVLAAAFGIRFYDGYALDQSGTGRVVFSRNRGTLGSHWITDGRNTAERVDSVATYTGQAFRVDPDVDAVPLLVLPEEFWVVFPEDAADWSFSETLPRVPAVHLLQGAVLEYGRGRLAVFGEAAMFSAQLSGENRRPMGMNRPEAAQNPQLVLNVLHWLTGSGSPR